MFAPVFFIVLFLLMFGDLFISFMFCLVKIYLVFLAISFCVTSFVFVVPEDREVVFVCARQRCDELICLFRVPYLNLPSYYEFPPIPRCMNNLFIHLHYLLHKYNINTFYYSFIPRYKIYLLHSTPLAYLPSYIIYTTYIHFYRHGGYLEKGAARAWSTPLTTLIIKIKLKITIMFLYIIACILFTIKNISDTYSGASTYNKAFSLLGNKLHNSYLITSIYLNLYLSFAQSHFQIRTNASSNVILNFDGLLSFPCLMCSLSIYSYYALFSCGVVPSLSAYSYTVYVHECVRINEMYESMRLLEIVNCLWGRFYYCMLIWYRSSVDYVSTIEGSSTLCLLTGRRYIIIARATFFNYEND